MLLKKSPLFLLPAFFFSGLLCCFSAVGFSATDKEIVLKVTSPNGEELKDVKVYKNYYLQNDKQQGREYTCDHNGLLTLDENDLFKYEWQRKSVMLYALDENTFSGFIDLNSDDLGKNMELKLSPACKISIKLTSADLKNLGREVNWTNIQFSQNNKNILSTATTSGNFEFFLPAGEYNLYIGGAQLYSKFEQIKIQAGQKELNLNYDLEAERIVHLFGKQSPEIQKMKGWLYSKPLTLKELRGKVVLIDFWGTWCGPCVAEIPNMIKLYDTYHDKGLVIIGIHDDSLNSIKDLEKKIDELSKNNWDNKKIPFPIALDGGGNQNIEGNSRSAKGINTAAYGIQKWPTIIIIDKQGKLIKEYNRKGDTEIIEKLLSE